jgi:cytochrome c2
MRPTMILSIAGAVTLAAVSPILAQRSESGSTTSGRRVATTICGNCHDDSTSSRKPSVGPNLADIANRPSTTLLSLKEFLFLGTSSVCPILFFRELIPMK